MIEIEKPRIETEELTEMESTADLLLNRSSVALATHWATATQSFAFFS